MEVDILQQAADDSTSADHTEEEGYILEPMKKTGMGKSVKKKRRLLVDADKELTGEQIKIQLDDFKDLLQPKHFAPRMKKALRWKEVDKLFSSPTVFSLGPALRDLIIHNYSVDIPDEPAVIEVDENMMPAEDVKKDSSNATLQDCAKVVGPAMPEMVLRGESDNSLYFDNGLGIYPGGEQPKDTPAAIPDMPNLDEQQGTEDNSFDIDDDLGCMDCPEGEQLKDTPAAAPKAIPDIPNVNQQQRTKKKQSNEIAQEFELRSIQKTDQVLGVLQKELAMFISLPLLPIATGGKLHQGFMHALCWPRMV